MKTRSNLLGYLTGILMSLTLLNCVWGNISSDKSEMFNINNMNYLEDKFQESLVYRVEPGKFISFDASESFDLDGDSILYYWIYDEKKSSYKNSLGMFDTIQSKLELEVPKDLNQDTLIFNLKIQDDSEFKLFTSKQVVLLAKSTFAIVSEPVKNAKIGELYSYKFELSFDNDDSIDFVSHKLPDWLKIKELNREDGFLILEGIPLAINTRQTNNIEISVSNGSEVLSQSFYISFDRQFYSLEVLGGKGTGLYEAGDTVWIIGDSIDMNFDKWTGDIQFLNDQNSSISYIVIPEEDILLTANYEDIKKSGEYDSDSDIISIPLINSEDDAEEYNNGTVNTGRNSLELVTNSLKDISNNAVGLIFRDVYIPEGKTIKGAFIRFTVDDLSEKSNNMRISGILEPDCRPFTEWDNDISLRNTTENTVDWKPFSWTQIGELEYTTDLLGVVKEVISQEYWEQGNAIGFVFMGEGGQIAKAFEGASNENQIPTLILKLEDGDIKKLTTSKHDLEHKTKIYPNPASNYLNIETEIESVKRIKIIDLTGRILFESFNFYEPIDISGMETGNYVVLIETHDGNVITKKMVKL